MSILSGLDSLGLGNVEKLDLYEKEKIVEDVKRQEKKEEIQGLLMLIII